MNNCSGSPQLRKIYFDDIDPFIDRLSRNIRNTLSEALLETLSRKRSSDYQAAAENWLAEKPAVGCKVYIHDRLHRYDIVIEKITASQLDDALIQSLI